MTLEAWRTRAQEQTQRGRARAQHVLALFPGLFRLFNELKRVEVIDRTMVVAAQALLSLVPLFVILQAFLPDDVRQLLVERFDDITELGLTSQGPVDAGLSSDTVRSQTGYVGIAVTILSATSFARAMKRMYQKAWNLRHIGGVAGNRRAFAWLIEWLLASALIGVAGIGLRHVGLALIASVFQLLATVAVWTASAWLLLLGRVGFWRLAPGGALTGILLMVYGDVSDLVMPRYAEQNYAQLGVFGLVLAIATWLIGFAFIIVVATVVGRILVEDPQVRSVFGRLRNYYGPTGQQLEEQQEDQSDP